MTNHADLSAALVGAAPRPWAIAEDRVGAIAALLAEAHRGQASESTLAAAAGNMRAAVRPDRVLGSQGGVTAIVPIRGLILHDFHLPPFATGMRQLRATINELAADPEIARIVLDTGSPGGSVFGVEEAAAAIFQARQRKPVIAAVSPFAASAAFHLISQSTEIVITPSGETGSLGVFWLHANLSEALRKSGVDVTIIQSKASPFKTEQGPFGPLSKEAAANAQQEVDTFAERFIADVARGRGVPIATVKATFGQGRMVLAREAVRRRMADRLGSFESALSTRASRERGRGGAASRSSAPPRFSDNPEALRRRLDILRKS